MAKARFTLEEAQSLRKRYEAGENSIALSTEFNVGDSCIRDWIKKAGGIIKTNSESKRIYSFNEQYFNSVDTEDKAYWLGFLVADGFTSSAFGKRRTVHIELSFRDITHLYKLRSHINFTGKIRSVARQSPTSGKFFRKAKINLTSMPMVQALENLNWFEVRDAGSPKILYQVPQQLRHHFIRGYFDGDGCICVKQRKDRPSLVRFVTIVGAHHEQPFLETMRNEIVSGAGVSYLTLKKLISTCAIKWTGNLQVKKIYDWMYKDATVFLERKKVKFGY